MYFCDACSPGNGLKYYIFIFIHKGWEFVLWVKLWHPWTLLNYILTLVLCAYGIYVQNIKFWAWKIILSEAQDTKWKKRSCQCLLRWTASLVVTPALHWPFRNLRACHFNKKTSYPSPSPINHHAMLGRHRQNHQEKALWCKSSIKSNCHTESLQQAPLH